MDLKTEYIIRQLGRTKNKKFEMYVVNRVINLINDLDIKFVTQQYVLRPDGCALTDLYFPQFNLHIEVDEAHHKQNIESDKIREADIINATEHTLIRIDVNKTIIEINSQIDLVVDKIRTLKKEQVNFKPWDIEAEFNPETYIKLGYIDIQDNVAFKTIADGCNCFGHNYKGYQRAGAIHAIDKSILIWFPKLYKNNGWNNSLSPDEMTIIEKPLTNKYDEHIVKYLENIGKYHTKRIVFARVKDNLGNVLYRFKGLYELDEKSSLVEGRIWNRLATRVETVSKKDTL